METIKRENKIVPAHILTIDGINISEFKIFNNSFEDAVKLSERLSDSIGINLTVHEGEMVKDEHYIILDGTELIAHKYSISI